MIKRKAILIPVLILAAGFFVMKILTTFRTEPARRTPAPQAKIVRATIAKLQNVPAEIIAYGRLGSAQPVILYSEVSGKLERGDVPFQPAQSFKKGDLLVKIDDRQVRFDLNSAKSDFLNALASVLPEIRVDFPADYEIWQQYFNNSGFDQKIATLPEASNQKIKLFLSRFNVYKLYFTVRNLEILLNKHFFYAPFDGSIVSADLRVGSSARNGTRLGEIINLENLEVEVPVPAQDIQWLDHTKPVRFTSSEIAGEWSGEIKRIGKSIDERTQTVQVFISVDQSHKEQLYNGVFLKAYIPGLIIDAAISVPRKALYNEGFVYLIKDGKLDFREVKIARKETDSVIVTDGIYNGDTLVVEVLQGVAPGMLAKAKISEAVGGSN